MKEYLRVCFRSAVKLATLRKTVHAQPSPVTEISNGRASFVAIADLVYFTSANSLGRTRATAAETIVHKDRFVTLAKSFMKSNDLLILASSAERRSTCGVPSRNNSTDKQELHPYVVCKVVFSGYQVAHGFSVLSSSIGYPAAPFTSQ